MCDTMKRMLHVAGVGTKRKTGQEKRGTGREARDQLQVQLRITCENEKDVGAVYEKSSVRLVLGEGKVQCK